MNRFALLLMLATVLACSLPNRVSGQATGIIVETYAENIGMVGSTDLTGYNTYRLYVEFSHPDDFLAAVYGDVDYPTVIDGNNNFYQSPLGGLTNETFNSVLFAGFPDLEFDSFVTIGMDSPANSTNGEAPVNAVADPSNNWINAFEPGQGAPGANINISSLTGGSWFPLFPDANGFAGDDLFVLIGQFTTDGEISGTVGVATFIQGSQSNQVIESFSFSSIPDAVFGCTVNTATNFNPFATQDDGSCVFVCDDPAVQISVSAIEVDPPSCTGFADGGFQVHVTGGQGGLTFGLDEVENATGIFGGMSAGNWSVTITDGVGCSITEDVTVTDPLPLTISAELALPISCTEADDGVIIGSSEGGTGDVQYSLTAPSYDAMGAAFFDDGSVVPEFEALAPGVYTVHGIDSEGCVGNSPAVALAEPQPFTLYAQDVVDASCAAAADGTILLNFFGGSGNSTTYSLDGNTFASNSLFNVPPGTYTAFAMDVNGCSDVLEDIVVGGSVQINLDYAASPPSCAGEANGQVELGLSGGTGSLNVTFDGESIDVDGAVTNLSPGVYPVLVTDEVGCEADFEVVVEDQTAVSLEAIVVQNAPCQGETGSVSLLASGGVGPYVVQNSGSEAFEALLVLDGLPVGGGVLSVLDANGCEASTPFVIGEPAALMVQLESIQPTTPGSSEGTIAVSLSGGTSPYTTFWTRDDGVVVSSAQNPTGLSAGTYSLALSDANGCALTVPGFVVSEVDVEGCTDVAALNFSPGATLDDGSCIYPGCEDFEGTDVDFATIVPGALEGTFGVVLERELVLMAGNLVVEPSTGTQYTLLQFSPDTAFGLPAGLNLGGVNADLAAGESLCLTLEGTPLETGSFEVTIEGEMAVSVFGLPFSAGRTAVSFVIDVLENPNPILGCTYPNAANFLVFATVDDGSCLIPGCLDPEAINHSPHFNVPDDSCVYASDFGGSGDDVFCRADFDASGLVGSGDLLIFLTAFAGACIE